MVLARMTVLVTGHYERCFSQVENWEVLGVYVIINMR